MHTAAKTENEAEGLHVTYLNDTGGGCISYAAAALA